MPKDLNCKEAGLENCYYCRSNELCVMNSYHYQFSCAINNNHHNVFIKNILTVDFMGKCILHYKYLIENYFPEHASYFNKILLLK